jgi:hypothetical protein
MISQLGRRFPALCVAAVVVAVCCAAAAQATTPPTRSKTTLTGTWTGSYSGAFTGTFRFTWGQTGSKLAGRIHLSNPAGNYGISGSVGRDGGIQFGVVGAGATYKGSVSGTSMSGTYTSPQGNGSWSAHKLVIRKRPKK